MPFITQGKTNLKYILIVVILAVIVGGGILGYYYSWIKDLETKLAEIEVRLPRDETINWETYRYEDWGFSMQIHPDHTKKEEKEVDRETIRIKAIIFSAEQEKITIIIDQSDDVKMLRSAIFDALKEIEVSQEQAIQYMKYFWGIVEPGVEVISVGKVEKGNCVGIQFTEKSGGKYKQNLILTSLDIDDMYLTVSFENYPKASESKILKMIETIECTK